MDGLLLPVSTTYTKKASRYDGDVLQESKPTETASIAAEPRRPFSATSANEALEILRNEPDYDTLVSVLHYLVSATASTDIRRPSPLSAQIVQVLVTGILPHYWTVLLEESDKKDEDDSRAAKKKQRLATSARSDVELFLSCLRSVTGLSALTVRLRALLAEAKTRSSAKNKDGQPLLAAVWELKAVVQVMARLLGEERSVRELWTVTVAGSDSEAQRRPLSQEYLQLLGGGRIQSLAAEAEALVKEQSSEVHRQPFPWVADGRAYSRWLTRGVIHWNSLGGPPEEKRLWGGLLEKAMRLGYPESVIDTLMASLLSDDTEEGTVSGIIEQLSRHEQKKILTGILRAIPIPDAPDDSTATDRAPVVSAVAGLVERAVGASPTLREQLASWLLISPAVGAEHGSEIRRAAVAVLAKDDSSLTMILERSLAEFGDQLFIKHSPMMQQEAKAQVLLIAAGYTCRKSPRTLSTMLRSRTYLSTISNRLSASQTRARFLGMVVGEALSGLVDGTKQLNFDMEELSSDEAKWYKALPHIQDTVGSIELLRPQIDAVPMSSGTAQRVKPRKQPPIKKPQTKPAVPRTTGFVIEEVDSDDGGNAAKDDSDSDDSDLVPYAKPDSDAEDSDDDPTMIRRDKPKQPVYIRDLITYFRDTENYDKQRLALTTAPVLIRRKATFGTEVQQHARDLASILVGLQDTFDMEDFFDLRLQGMVAIVVAQPKMVGPWLASSFFDGDYSLAQRASMLTTLGLAARELAGLETSEFASAAAFPSKQLPDGIAKLYISPAASEPQSESARLASASSRLKALPSGVLDGITDSLTAGFLGPIAAKVADEATGPDVLKLASFKSRVRDSSDKKGVGRKGTAGRKPTGNSVAATAAPIIAGAIFFPLMGRFQLALQATAAIRSSSLSSRGVLFDPSLLSLFLKTLAVSLHAAGPTALVLADMTAELWALLLGSSVQAHCVGDVTVTHAVLFALLALLDVNEGRMREICRTMAREVVQTRDWALQVLENMRLASTSGGGLASLSSDSQESEIQMLAAGVYLRLSEGMESYRSLLLGEMIGS